MFDLDIFITLISFKLIKNLVLKNEKKAPTVAFTI